MKKAEGTKFKDRIEQRIVQLKTQREQLIVQYNSIGNNITLHSGAIAELEAILVEEVDPSPSVNSDSNEIAEEVEYA